MENTVFVKYSDFFEDDGGFKKVIADFDILGNELVNKANKYKKDINDAFNTLNVDALKKSEAEIEAISREAKELATIKKQLSELEKQHADAIGKSANATSNATDSAKNRTREEVLLNREIQRGIDNEIKKNGVLFQVYSRTQAKLSLLVNTYREVALKQELGISLTKEESAQLATLESRIQKYDSALKKVDANSGRFQRNVGNYASAYNGLGNSINQITRELPAFTFSTQTGILALSNNIPILTDEIGRLVKANKELAGQGKPVTSVLTQIMGGIFSLQTAMGAGILLLALYGKEMGEWIDSTFTNAKALKDQEEWLKKTNDQLKERGKVLEENTNFEKEIIQQYEKQTAQLISLRNAQGQNEQKNAVEEKNTNLERVARLRKMKDDEVKVQEEILNKRRELYLKNLPLEQAKRDEAINSAKWEGWKLGTYKKSAKELKATAEKRLQDYKNNYFKQNEFSMKELEETRKQRTDLLTLEEDYTKELATLQAQAETDRYRKLLEAQNNTKASASELRQFIISEEIKKNEDIFTSDKYNVDQRLAAQKALVAAMKKLAKEDRSNKLRDLKFDYDREREVINKNLDGEVITKKYGSQLLLQLERKYGTDRKLVVEQYNSDIAAANKKADNLSTTFRLEAQKAYFERQRKDLSNTSHQWELYNIQISKAQFLIEQLSDKPATLFAADNLETSRKELVEISDYVAKVQKQLAGRSFSGLSKVEQAKVLKEVEKLEKEKAAIQLKYDIEERNNEIRNIDRQLENESYGTKKQLELQTKKNKLLLQNQDETAKALIDSTKNTNKEIAEDFDRLIKAVIDRFIEVTQKRVEQDQKAVESQKSAIQVQQERAAAGLSNTLAFEQKELAKRETELLKQQKREERLQKVKALYSSYSAYASKGDTNALLKSLRDFSILEAITASFGDGGAVDDVLKDKIPHDRGIIRGRSHKGQHGGIPVLVEGKEGFFSSREMQNLGKGNFYKIKEAAGAGRVDENFFGRQRGQFVTAMTVSSPANTELIHGLKEVKKSIDSKPVTNWDVRKHTEGILDVVEETIKKGKVTRTHYITKKRGF